MFSESFFGKVFIKLILVFDDGSSVKKVGLFLQEQTAITKTTDTIFMAITFRNTFYFIVFNNK